MIDMCMFWENIGKEKYWLLVTKDSDRKCYKLFKVVNYDRAKSVINVLDYFKVSTI